MKEQIKYWINSEYDFYQTIKLSKSIWNDQENWNLQYLFKKYITLDMLTWLTQVRPTRERVFIKCFYKTFFSKNEILIIQFVFTFAAGSIYQQSSV